MPRPWSIRFQLFVTLALLGAGAGLWLSKDRIGEALANLQQNATAPQNGSEKSEAPAGGKGGAKSRGAAPVIVARVETRRNDERVAAIGTARARKSVMLYADAEGEVLELPVKPGDRVADGQPLLVLTQRRAKLAVELARTALADAKQKLERANYLRRRNVNSGASVEDAQIAVDLAELQVKRAEEDLRDRTLDAPFAGVVGIPKIEPGDRVTADTAVLSLDDRSELLVEFLVPEKFLSRIKVGDPVEATTPSFARRTFAGIVGYIDSRVDAVSRTVMVRAVLPNGDDLLRPGMSFAIALMLPGDTYPAVPELSLQWADGDSYVWLVAENKKVRKVVVETVRRMNATILVEGPLQAGDFVVVEGVQRLRDGTDVSYAPPAVSPDEAPSEKESGTAPETETGTGSGSVPPASRRSTSSENRGRG